MIEKLIIIGKKYKNIVKTIINNHSSVLNKSSFSFFKFLKLHRIDSGQSEILLECIFNSKILKYK